MGSLQHAESGRCAICSDLFARVFAGHRRSRSGVNVFDFRSKVVVVTGAARNIGRGIALRCGEAGASVGVFCLKSASDEVCSAIGSRAIAVRADLSDRSEVERAVGEVVNAFGHVDVLVNNAGIYPVVPLMEMSETDFDETIAAD